MKKWKSLKTGYKIFWIIGAVALAAAIVVIVYFYVIACAAFGEHPVRDPIIKASQDGTKQLVIPQ